MKFNTIILCFTVWASAGILSIFLSIYRSQQEKKLHQQKANYLRQFLFLAEKGKTSGEIVKELYYFFIADKQMRNIMFKAMRLQNTKALDYIYKKIGCGPMKILHGFLLKREGQNRCKPLPEIPEDIVRYFNNLINQWEEDARVAKSQMRSRKLKNTCEIAIFMVVNYYFYMWLKSEISLWIFAIVNTLGVIIFIAPENKKTHWTARGIQGLYQLVSGMGLIINIFIVVSGWLGPVA